MLAPPEIFMPADIIPLQAAESQTFFRGIRRLFPRGKLGRALLGAGYSRRWLALGIAVSVLACGSDPEARLEEIRSQQEIG
jgi:hypothetical protein